MGSLINHFPGSSETSPFDQNGMVSQFADSIIGKPVVVNMTLLCMFCSARGQHELLDCSGFRLGYRRDPLHSKTG
jgi:hypothetical protein